MLLLQFQYTFPTIDMFDDASGAAVTPIDVRTGDCAPTASSVTFQSSRSRNLVCPTGIIRFTRNTNIIVSDRFQRSPFV